jgi:hypothetical protein
LTVLDASQTQVGLGICETLLNVGVEVDSERKSAGLKTVAVRLQDVDRLEVDFFVLKDHHIADIAVFHRDISMVKELKKVKENELSTVRFELTRGRYMAFPVLPLNYILKIENNCWSSDGIEPSLIGYSISTNK